MSLSLQLKNSVVAGKLPAPSQLGVGEIGLNYHKGDPFLVCCDSDGVIRRLNSISVGNTAPGSPTPGLPWIDTSGNAPVLKVWVSSATQWATLSGGSGPNLPITTDEIADGAVTSAKIADGGVEATNLATAAVETSALADQAVTGLKLADQAVDGSKLAAAAVTTAALGNEAVTSAKLAAGSVTAVKLSAQSVITAALADSSVTTGKISAGAIISSLIANGAVGTAPSAVDTTNLANGAVTSDKLADGGVSSAKIADGAVKFEAIDPTAVTPSTEAWVASDTAFPTTAAVQAQLDAAPGKQVDTDHIKDLAVTSGKLADRAVTSTKINPGAVSFSGLSAGAVLPSGQTWSASDVKLPTSAAVQAQIDAIPERQIGTAQLDDGAVTEPKLADDAVSKVKIANGAVDLTKIDPSSVLPGTTNWANVDTQLPTAAAVQKYVTNLPKGPINTGDITDKAVTGAKIADGTISNQQLASSAVAFGNITAGAVQTSTTAWQNSDVVLPTTGAVNARVNAVISAQTIQTSNIADLAVTTEKLALGAVTNPILGQGAVQFDNLNEDLLSASTESWVPSDTQIPTTQAVTKYFHDLPVPIIDTANLADNAVTTAKIAPGAVVNDRIRQGTIQFDRLSVDAVRVSSEPWVATDSTIPTTKAVADEVNTLLTNLVIGTEQIADFAVTTDKLGNVSVTTAKLATGAVTHEKLAPSSVQLDNFTAGLVNNSTEDWNPSDSVLPTVGLVDKQLTTKLQDLEIQSGQIADEAVTTSKLAPLAVTNAKLSNSAITFNKLASGLVLTSSEDWNATDITLPSTAATNSRITERLNSWIVDREHIGNGQVTTEKIADQAVTNAQIADLTVGTAQIADESVTPIKLDREYISGPATKTHLGGIKVGANLIITADGTLSAESGPTGGIVDTIVPGSGIQVDGSSDPANPVVSALVAKTDQLGSVIVGANLNITPEGVLSATAGGGDVDSVVAGGGITVDNADPVNPKVSVKVGESLTIDPDDGTLEVNAAPGPGIDISAGTGNSTGFVVSAKPATPSELGSIKVGEYLSVTPDGTLSVVGGGGGVIDTIKTTADGLNVDSTDPTNVVINLEPATTGAVGGVKVGDGLVVTADGTLSAEVSSPSITICKEDTTSYTVKNNDYNRTVVFRETTANSSVILDGSTEYRVGSIIDIVCSTASDTQIVPINEAQLDTGYPGGFGRAIPVTKTSAKGTPYTAQYARAMYIGDKIWTLRAPMLTMGAPYISYAGRVDKKFSAGKIQVFSNATGENLARISTMQFTATPKDFTGETKIVKGSNKDTSAVIEGLEEGKRYTISTQYIYDDGTTPDAVRQSVNTIDVLVDSSVPLAPQNLKVVGYRGARAFITFDYDDTISAPWDFIEAQALSSTGDVVCDWVPVCSAKDQSPVYPYYYVQFWPTNPVQGDNTLIKIRLCTNSGIKGASSFAATTNWDQNLITPEVTVNNSRGSTIAKITWKLTEGSYNPPDCRYSVVIREGGERIVYQSTPDWNDANGVTFNGNTNVQYYVDVTAQTYGRSNNTVVTPFKFVPFR